MEIENPLNDETDSSDGSQEPTVDDIVRLLKAFRQIIDPDRKAEILTLAEQHASKSSKLAGALQMLTTKH